MLKLLTYPAALGEFSPSPFCVKAALLLQMSGQPWQREDVSDPRKTRYGKLPVLRAGPEVIADSDNIRAWLEAQGAEFDPGLSPRDKAASRAVIRMAEEHMYFILMLDRWGNDDVWPTIRDTYFGSIPPVVRHLVAGGLRRDILKGLNVQGLGRFSAEDRLARVDADLVALARMLDGQPFLFGSRMTAADASVGAMLSAMRSTPMATPLARRIADDGVLSPYVDRATACLPATG